MKRSIPAVYLSFSLLFLCVQCEKLLKTEIKVQTGIIIDQSYRTAVIEGNVTEFGKGLSEHGHCWSTLPSPTINLLTKTSLGSRKSTGPFTSSLTNLTPGTTYYIRAYALNEDQEAAYGEELELTTISQEIPSVTTSSVSTFTATSAIIGGEVTSDGGDSIIERGVYWGTSPNPSGTGNGTKMNIGKGTGPFSGELPGLTPGETYYVEAFARNNVGIAIGGQVIFSTHGLAPTPAFSASKTVVDIGETITFSDQSENSPTSWNWDFGDGLESNEQDPNHSYNAAGTYTVKLKVSNAFGTDSTTRVDYIRVGNAPLADFTASETRPKVGEAVQFTDQSQHNPSAWSWNFGDGTSDTGQNPSHVYYNAGAYTVTLNATNDYGSDSEVKTDYIVSGNPPSAAFSVSTTQPVAGVAVQFTDESSNWPSSWFWEFGDGTTSNEQHPTHIYKTDGPYSVDLTVTNDYGTSKETKNNFIQVVRETVTDIDGNVYEAVIIGEQTWFAENLKVTKFNNGDNIVSLISTTEWKSESPGNPVRGCIDIDCILPSTYGYLYNWNVVIDTRNVCPAGWHVPSEEEWELLVNFLGGSTVAGGKLKEEGTDHWTININGTNEVGFTALPGGEVHYNPSTGNYNTQNLGTNAFFWSSTVFPHPNSAYTLELDNTSGRTYISSMQQYGGYSIRCIKD